MKVHSNHFCCDTRPSCQSLARYSLLLIILAIAVSYTICSVSPLRAAQTEQPSAAISPTTNPYSQNALTPYYKQAARYILEQTGYDQKKGYCFVLVLPKGNLSTKSQNTAIYTFLQQNRTRTTSTWLETICLTQICMATELFSIKVLSIN